MELNEGDNARFESLWGSSSILLLKKNLKIEPYQKLVKVLYVKRWGAFGKKTLTFWKPFDDKYRRISNRFLRV